MLVMVMVLVICLFDVHDVDDVNDVDAVDDVDDVEGVHDVDVVDDNGNSVDVDGVCHVVLFVFRHLASSVICVLLCDLPRCREAVGNFPVGQSESCWQCVLQDTHSAGTF